VSQVIKIVDEKKTSFFNEKLLVRKYMGDYICKAVAFAKVELVRQLLHLLFFVLIDFFSHSGL
jgi:hypothetical protein